jgi:hypothetical protein
MLPYNPLGFVLIIYYLGLFKFRHTLDNNILVGSVAKGNYILNVLGISLLVVLYMFFN